MRRLCAAVAVAYSLVAYPLLAEAWDPFPRLEAGQRVAIKQTIDGPTYDSLRRCLDPFPSSVGASYWAVVVEVTSPRGVRSASDGNAVPYADALADSWDDRLGDDHVLMVVSTLNRGVAIHVGETWARRGMESARIQRVIDASRFGSLAREGDIGRGLCALAESFDRELERLAPAESSVPSFPSASTPQEPVRGVPRTSSSGGGCGLPILGLGLLLVLLPALAWRRRRGERKKAADEVERWRQLLARAAERLLDLERRHPLFFATGDLRWSGESAGLDRATAHAVNRLYLLYSAAYAQHDRAARALDGAGTWSLAATREAWRLLHDETIDIDAEAPLADDAAARTVPLALEAGITLPASALPSALEEAFADAATQLAKAEQAEQARHEATAQADRAAAAALEAIEARAALELPSGHLSALLEPLLERREQVVARPGDPVGLAAELEQVAEELDALAERARRGNHTIETLRGELVPSLTTSGARVDELRAAGHALREPGFAPLLRLERARRQADQVIALLVAGDESEAHELFTALADDLAQLTEQIEASAAARQEVPDAVAALGDATAALAERLPRARTELDALHREHHPDAFAREADNLVELDTLLQEIDSWREHIIADHREDRMLSALEDLETLRRLVSDGETLLDEIDTAAASLDEARQRVRSRLATTTSTLEQAERLGARPGVAASTRAALSDATATLRRVASEAGGEQPHWPRLEAQAAAAHASLDDASSAAEHEAAAFEQARTLLADQRRRLDALERQIARETRDRPPVAEATAEARARLDELARALEPARAGSSDGDAAGDDLLESVQALAQTVRWAEEGFQREMEAVRLAETERAAAARTIERAARRDFGFGIRPDSSAASLLFQRADDARRALRWDEVASLSRRAREMMEDEMRQRRAEAQRIANERHRRLLAARAAEQAARSARRARTTSSLGWSGRGGAGSSFGRRSRRGASGGSSFGGGGASGGSRW